jgi:hypothetical protein
MVPAGCDTAMLAELCPFCPFVQAALNGLSAWSGATPKGSDTAAGTKGAPDANTSNEESNAGSPGTKAAAPQDASASTSTTDGSTAEQANAASSPASARNGEQHVGFGVQQVLADPRDHEQYVHVGGRQMVGLYLSVWARKPIADSISCWQVRFPSSNIA